MTSLSTVIASEIEERSKNSRWLIENIWVDEGVGIIGGQPKCCKSFLALDIAVSVASGTKCLRKYDVKNSGRVLLFAAEDSLHIVKRRLQGICNTAGIPLDKLDIHVITSPVLRLDEAENRLSLQNTVENLKPKMLILDPFIRIHRIDENNSGEVGKILAFLRALNRSFNVSVVVVHHAKKRSDQRAGQSLRGSSEFHAWGDSNLYLTRDRQDTINLSIEHRSEKSGSGMKLELKGPDDALALSISNTSNIENNIEEPAAVETKIHDALKIMNKPASIEEVRASLKMRRNTVCDAMKNLVNQGTVTKTILGYQISAH